MVHLMSANETTDVGIRTLRLAMLEHLGFDRAARRVEEAVVTDFARSTAPRSTSEVGDAIAELVAG